jgi:pimeloyl-ACP methyl ester carboxylesterase
VQWASSTERPTIATVLQSGTDLEVDGELVATGAGTPLWLPCGSDVLYGVLHAPASGPRRSAAVLLVGPFGWDDISCYRARREWACALADHGFAALRVDLPGTGDSSGSASAPETIGRWAPAIAEAGRWLRDVTEARRVAAIAIGLGGIACVQSLAQGAGFDDLVLWGTGARGRAVVRELRAFAAMVIAGIGDDAGAAQSAPAAGGTLAAAGTLATVGASAGDVLDVAGFALSAEAAAKLERIDLTALELVEGRPGRVLLIGRGGSVDERLRAHFEDAGVAVTSDPGADYDDLIAPAQAAAVPRATIARSIEWLTEAAGDARDAPPLRAVGATSSITITLASTEVRETLVGYDVPGGRLVAVVTEPVATTPTREGGRGPASLCLVLPNAGAIRRSGPNRMWTELARRTAARGLAAIRFDIPGIGDAPGDATALISDEAYYEQPLVELELELLDRLGRAGVADRFVAAGLCSSSYWGWQAALRDGRVLGAILINLYAFEYSRELVLERDRRRTMEVMRAGMIARLRRKGLPRAELRRAVTALLSALRSPRERGGSIEDAQRGAIAEAFGLLARRGTRVLLVFSRRELLLEQLERQGQLAALATWPNLAVERLTTADHELRIRAIQEVVIARIDALLDELSPMGR